MNGRLDSVREMTGRRELACKMRLVKNQHSFVAIRSSHLGFALVFANRVPSPRRLELPKRQVTHRCSDGASGRVRGPPFVSGSP